jgi:hypothetical protein
MLVRRPDVASGVRRRSDLTPEPQHFKEEQTNPAWAFAQLCRLGFGLVTVSYTNLVGQIRISRSPTHATNATGDWFLPHRIWALSGLPPSAGLSRGGRMLLFVFSGYNDWAAVQPMAGGKTATGVVVSVVNGESCGRYGCSPNWKPNSRTWPRFVSTRPRKDPSTDWVGVGPSRSRVGGPYGHPFQRRGAGGGGRRPCARSRGPPGYLTLRFATVPSLSRSVFRPPVTNGLKGDLRVTLIAARHDCDCQPAWVSPRPCHERSSG